MRTTPILEAQHHWGSTVLESIQLNAEDLTVGARLGAGPRHFDAPPFALTADCFPLVRWIEGEPHVTTHPSLEGWVRRGGRVEALAEWASRGEADAELPDSRTTRVRDGEEVTITHGSQSFRLRRVSSIPFEATPLSERINYPWLNTLMLVGFAHVMAVVLLSSASAARASGVDELFTRNLQMQSYRFKPTRPQPPKKLSEAPERSARGGLKTANKSRRTRSPDGSPNASSNAAAGIESIMAGLSRVTRGREDGALERALAGIESSRHTVAGIEGARDLRSGGGGGGLEGRTVALGVLSTGGRGGGDKGGYDDLGSLGPKPDRGAPTIVAGLVTVEGSLDRELIRRVVEEHRSQVRYCYERALVSDSGLFGKVELEWVIDATGSVSRADVKSSTMGSAAVESCLRAKVSAWTFPKPRGGGIVVVRYPFVFRSR
ncbi:MAG: AgmX/PglI C-terminal domain-containing protein [Deltaproteobacteria bacterium]|nr:AgmX/PglI C-terminal domain-containing protein [Deltaproteobacteria bacterium]